MKPRRPPSRRRQRGVTLIMALIMLTLLTLLSLASFNLGKSNLQIVGNMQRREEALAAADAAIEEAISSTRFFSTPTDALASPCGGNGNTRCVDTDGDNVADVTVTLTPAPTCVKVQNVKNTSLDLSDEEDLGCSGGGAPLFGVAGAVTGDSLCANSVWEIHAVATDNVSEATVEVTQGVSVRVAKDDIATSCP